MAHDPHIGAQMRCKAAHILDGGAQLTLVGEATNRAAPPPIVKPALRRVCAPRYAVRYLALPRRGAGLARPAAGLELAALGSSASASSWARAVDSQVNVFSVRPKCP